MLSRSLSCGRSTEDVHKWGSTSGAVLQRPVCERVLGLNSGSAAGPGLSRLSREMGSGAVAWWPGLDDRLGTTLAGCMEESRSTLVRPLRGVSGGGRGRGRSVWSLVALWQISPGSPGDSLWSQASAMGSVLGIVVLWVVPRLLVVG
jgi:hypothetical protein